ncbi:hypothetical protein JYT83_01500 [bacterium AH-315-F18]|nr:hypothetical protein [bacterium AH-315-F18]
MRLRNKILILFGGLIISLLVAVVPCFPRLWDCTVVTFGLSAANYRLSLNHLDDMEDPLPTVKRLVVESGYLASQLMKETDGSLAAEGMKLAVDAMLPDAEAQIVPFLQDKRWNYWLSNNDQFARMCLLALKYKRGAPLTQNEHIALYQEWRFILKGDFGIDLPEPESRK